MTPVIIAIIGLCIFGLAVHRFGFATCAILVILISTAVFPRYLSPDSSFRHVGISSATPRLSTYLLAIGFVLVCFLFMRSRPTGAWIWLPFLASLAAGASLFWSGDAMQASGILQLLIAPAAWFVGAKLSDRFSVDNGSILVRVIACLIFLQLAVCCLQLVGLPINPMAATQEAILGLRTNGTLGHPNDLGKVIFLLLALLMSLKGGLARVDANLWKFAVGAGFLVLAMTGGRAVSAGALCLLMLWAILSPSQSTKKGGKIVALGIVASISVFLAGALLARFDEDPAGGDRSVLTDIAWAQIMSNPWNGVGPNSYVAAVGSYNSLTASGVPVHNAFLLAFAELGVVGAASLFLPFLVGALISLRHVRMPGLMGDAARAYVASIPGFYLISSTGWGVLGSYVLPMLALTYGLLSGWSRKKYSYDSTGPNERTTTLT